MSLATSEFLVHVIAFFEDTISAQAIGLDRKSLDEVTIESKELVQAGR